VPRGAAPANEADGPFSAAYGRTMVVLSPVATIW
jgi:hypothetical protein